MISRIACASGLLILTAMVAGCKHKQPQEQQTLSVEVRQPIVRTINYSKTFPAYISAEQSANIVARVNGTLQKILYTPGQQVSQGQLLFVIDPSTYEDNVMAAKAQLATAEANLRYAEGNYKMMQQAIKVDAVSEINLLQAKSSVESGKAAIESAKAQLATANTNLSYCYIRAPFAGRITKNAIDAGNYISGAGQPVQLASLFKEGKMYANMTVSNAEYMLIAEKIIRSNDKISWNDSVRIILPQFHNMSIRGRIDYTSPNVNLNTGTVSIRVIADNKNGILKDGMYAKVYVPYERIKNALLVPDASITTNQRGNSLYILGDSNIVKQQIVVPGQLVDDSLRVIQSGLSANQYFVTTALLQVHNGSKVNPIMPSNANVKR